MENENSGQTVSVDGTAGGTAMETQAEVRDNDGWNLDTHL